MGMEVGGNADKLGDLRADGINLKVTERKSGQKTLPGVYV
jgi:hypothetical protein